MAAKLMFAKLHLNKHLIPAVKHSSGGVLGLLQPQDLGPALRSDMKSVVLAAKQLILQRNDTIEKYKEVKRNTDRNEYSSV